MSRSLKIVGWGATAITLILYAVMGTITLPHLTELAGGLTMFDLRPGGYDFETARQIVSRLGEEGRAYYAYPQHILDTFFPAFLAFTVSFWLVRAARRWRGHGMPLPRLVIVVLIVFAVVSAIADLGENMLVSVMLGTGAEELTPDLVAAASRYTLAKSVSGTVAYGALLVLAIMPFFVKKPTGVR